MCNRKMWMLTGVLLVAVVSAAQAQPGGQRGRGGFGGGFGGFGGGGGGLLGLLQVEEVRKEIEMLDDQIEAARKIGEELRGERQERPDFQNLSEAEREQLFAKMRQEAQERNKKAKAKLAEVLLPHQMERLEQINVQVQGIGALNDPEVAAKLKITPEQKTKVETVSQEVAQSMRERMQQIFQGGDREGMRDRMTALRKEMEGKVLAVLTTDQQKQFEAMKGKPFAMPQPQFGGGRGGRGEAGAGGGRPGGRERGGERSQRPPQ